MLRKLFILIFLVGSTCAFAQRKTAGADVTVPLTAIPAKSDKKPKDTVADYKQMGAPMPDFKVLLCGDTSAKTNGAGNGTTENPRQARRRKKRDGEAAKGDVYLTNKDVDNHANLFVMMFNPTCSHCEDETALLEKNIFLFNKSQIILMAQPGMKQYIPDFTKRLHTVEYPSIHVGMDSADFINKVFVYGMLPQINIYDHDRKLLRTFNGGVKIDSLKKYIE